MFVCDLDKSELIHRLLCYGASAVIRLMCLTVMVKFNCSFFGKEITETYEGDVI